MYHSFFIHSFTDGYLGCFQHLAIVNCAAMNIGAYMFFWIGVSGFLGYNPSNGIAREKGSSIFSFLRNSILFSIVAAQVCNPANSALGFPFSTPSQTFVVCCFVYDGRSDRFEVVSHCGFNLHLSDG